MSEERAPSARQALARARERALRLVAIGDTSGAMQGLLKDLRLYDGPDGWTAKDLDHLANFSTDLAGRYDRRQVVEFFESLR